MSSRLDPMRTSSRFSSDAIRRSKSCDTQEISMLFQVIQGRAGLIQIHDIRRDRQGAEHLPHCAVKMLGRHAANSQIHIGFGCRFTTRVRAKKIYLLSAMAKQNGYRFVNLGANVFQGCNLQSFFLYSHYSTGRDGFRVNTAVDAHRRPGSSPSPNCTEDRPGP